MLSHTGKVGLSNYLTLKAGRGESSLVESRLLASTAHTPKGSLDLLVPQAVDERVEHRGHHGI